jgi:hypothetical protein
MMSEYRPADSMTKASAELIELASLVEGLAGPDRETDEMIAEAIEPGMFTRDQHGRLRKNIHGTILNPQWDLWTPPAYTASLDAAMSLVPEGWTFIRVERSRTWEDDPRGDCIVFETLLLKLGGAGRAKSSALTQAPSICAAALLALASKGQTHAE